MLYSVIASFPLFFAGGFAIRLQDDLGINKSQFGLAISAYFITSTIASFTIGSWIDRRGARVGFHHGRNRRLDRIDHRRLVEFVLAVRDRPRGRRAVQHGRAARRQSSARRFGPERQGAGFGVKQAAVPMGSFLAGVAVSTIGSELDWRAAFFGYSVLALASVTIAPTGPGAASASEPRRPVGDDWPFLLALASAGLLGGATGNGLAVLTVDAFGAAGFAENVGATALAIGSAITIVGRTGLGWFAGRRKATGFVELGTAMAIGAIAFVIMAIADTNQVLIWVGVATRLPRRLGLAGSDVLHGRPERHDNSGHGDGLRRDRRVSRWNPRCPTSRGHRRPLVVSVRLDHSGNNVVRRHRADRVGESDIGFVPSHERSVTRVSEGVRNLDQDRTLGSERSGHCNCELFWS